MKYDAADNARKSYDVAIDDMRERLASFRCERIGPHTLFLGDCREILPLLGKVDAVVTDPPYGIGEARDKSSRTPIAGKTRLGTKSRVVEWYPATWDHETADVELSASLAKSRWAVVFGGNYYNLPPTSCWLVWDKLNSGDFADCELAWTNLPKAVRRLQYHWNGCMRKERHVKREHPTQKPIGVMKWCIEHIPTPNQTILDPFMGSGTTGVACVKLGRKFIGIEIEPKYFDIACKRIDEAMKQPDLFVASPEPKPEQLSLIGDDT